MFLLQAVICTADISKDEALHHQISLTALDPLNPHDLSFLQDWMKRPSMGNVYLIGRDSDIWSKPDLSDLIALHPRHLDNSLTKWLSDSMVHAYHRAVGRYFRVRALVQI